MPLIVLNPRTGTRVTLPTTYRPSTERRAKNWVLRELDRLADQHCQPTKRPA
jgi:hypothetical protein